MKKYATLGLAAGLGLILGTGSANAGAPIKNEAIAANRQQDKQQVDLPSQHCEATAGKQTKCLLFIGCREDEKAQKTVCEWAWQWDIEIID